MMTDPTHDLIHLSDAYAAHHNISHWRVSFLARGDGCFFKRLREGGGCTLRTAAKVTQWFSDNWPADLQWPRDITRPPKTKDAA